MTPPVKRHEGTGEPEPGDGGVDRSHLLPLLAGERALRALVLVGVGVILVAHTRTDWADLARGFAEQAGLDPSRNKTGRLISSLAGFGPHQARKDGSIAIGYGLLEAVEAYGLLRRRPWGEYLTVISTALLFIPEINELLTKPTTLKVVALTLNIIIVGYLVVRLVRRRRSNQ